MQLMGSLNFLAEEEYRAARERLDFHRKQVADLRAAREDLLEAIRRINETAGKMFEETFAVVQGHFLDDLRQALPGRRGRPSPCRAAIPLEGEIEIAARPRGKKLESIRLLSSGERALTAIALLFAIYLAKPSPVCLLDEVDAPLDDANLDRFLTLVRHFSERTQFICITHNKKTMEMADRLFGVTMQEPGHFELVSVQVDGRGAVIERTDGESRLELDAVGGGGRSPAGGRARVARRRLTGPGPWPGASSAASSAAPARRCTSSTTSRSCAASSSPRWAPSSSARRSPTPSPAGFSTTSIRQTVGQAQFIGPLDGWNARMLVSVLLGVVASLPFVSFQIWGFVLPGLHHRERRVVLPVVISSTVLFLVGMAFSWFFLTPQMLRLLAGFGTEHLKPNLAVGPLLDFVVKMSLGTGLLFELPLVILALT